MASSDSSAARGSLAACSQVFLVFLSLGCTSFGGPLAHIAWFRREFVERRAWLDAHAFADLVALCQILPGPASSQVGLAIGLMRAGLPGACAAWLGFTLPSALLMLALGIWILPLLPQASVLPVVLHGLKLAAVPVVMQAVWSMARSLCPDLPRAGLALLAAGLSAWWPGIWLQIALCAAGAAIGRTLLRQPGALPHTPFTAGLSPRTGRLLLLACLLLLGALPLAARLGSSPALVLVDAFYRAGALVFGGGHVVLPVLQAEVVTRGWVTPAQFLAGYGAAQALPGPLFTFAAYLGAIASQPPGGWLGGALALVAIFLPGALLVAGCLPLWERVRYHQGARRALLGVNAVVVGLLLGVLAGFVLPGAIHGVADAALALAGWALLTRYRLPAWALVLLTISCSIALGR